MEGMHGPWARVAHTRHHNSGRMDRLEVERPSIVLVTRQVIRESSGAHGGFPVPTKHENECGL